jgi:hypothetical protein
MQVLPLVFIYTPSMSAGVGTVDRFGIYHDILLFAYRYQTDLHESVCKRLFHTDDSNFYDVFNINYY